MGFLVSHAGHNAEMHLWTTMHKMELATNHHELSSVVNSQNLLEGITVQREFSQPLPVCLETQPHGIKSTTTCYLVLLPRIGVGEGKYDSFRYLCRVENLSEEEPIAKVVTLVLATSA